MSREDDDAYFENFSALDDQSRPPPRVMAPTPPRRTQQPQTYTPPVQRPSADDRYFGGFSVHDQGERFQHEAPTVRIPGAVIDQLAAAAAPSAPPTQVTYDAQGGIKTMTGQLYEPQQPRQMSDDAYFGQGVPVYDNGGRNSSNRLVPDSVIGQLDKAANQRGSMGMPGQPNNAPFQSGRQPQPNNAPDRGGWKR